LAVAVLQAAFKTKPQCGAQVLYRALDLGRGGVASVADLFHARLHGVERRLTVIEMNLALCRDRIKFSRAVGRCDGGQAHFFQQSQRGIDDTRRRAVRAADLVLDRFDDLVAVARGLGDQGEHDQAKIALVEHPAAASATAMLTAAAMPTSAPSAFVPEGLPGLASFAAVVEFEH
jgi:hypothetical protein